MRTWVPSSAVSQSFSQQEAVCSTLAAGPAEMQGFA